MIARLHPDDVELLADRVVDLLTERLGGHTASNTPLVSAAQLADLLGVSRSFIYDNADALGGRRLGKGERKTLRFDPDEARRGLDTLREPPAPPQPAPRPRRPSRGPARTSSGAPLLPIGGRRAA